MLQHNIDYIYIYRAQRYPENPGFTFIYSQKMHIWAGLTKVHLAHLIMVRFWQTYHQNDQQDKANWMEGRKTGKKLKGPLKPGIPVKTGKTATLQCIGAQEQWFQSIHSSVAIKTFQPTSIETSCKRCAATSWQAIGQHWNPSNWMDGLEGQATCSGV